MMRGHINMFVAPDLANRAHFLNIQFNGSDLPFIVDSGCAPLSVIPAWFLNGMVYDEGDRRGVEPYVYKDYQGTKVVVTEEIKLWVLTQIKSDPSKQRLARINFAVIEGGGPNCVLLSEDYFNKFGVESPEILIWKALGGALRRVRRLK